MALPLDQFVRRLAESGLTTAADVQAYVESLPDEERPQDSHQLARRLLKAGKLTAYQAQEVYKGAGKGLVLGNYVILDKLGQGGMGLVLKAEHKRMERLVALKILSPEVTKSDEILRRFQREVRAAARLTHPHIVMALDADEAGDTHFLVMEYVEGTDLAAYVKKSGPLPLEQALNCVLQAARGLEYAHQQGVVHRDIKPANLLLARSNTVKILDMGLARFETSAADDGLTDITSTNQIMGTVDYMAPEQAVNSKLVDQRADIYSLGIVLWYLLTGRVVYEGNSVVKKFIAHKSSPIPSLRSACPAASPELEAAFAKMIAKTPETRFQNMTEVIAALERCQGGLAPGPQDLGILTNSATPRKNSGILANSATGSSTPPASGHSWPKDAPPPALAPFSAAEAKKHQAAWARHLRVDVEITNSIGMKLALIPPGEFQRGGTPGEIEAAVQMADEQPDCQEYARSEGPQHKVVLTQAFYLGVHEVTQAQYEQVMGQNPSRFAPRGAGNDSIAGLDTGNLPVESVNWFDAAEFCARLSNREKRLPFYFRLGDSVTMLSGTGYRLPTEAEWEFACRAGTTTKYWVGEKGADLQRAGWYGANSGGRTHAVGELKANPFGLHDTHGNVWEWVQDWWEPTAYWQFLRKPAVNPSGPAFDAAERVIRGGNCSLTASFCRSSLRHARDPAFRHGLIGFRLALIVDASRTRS